MAKAKSVSSYRTKSITFRIPIDLLEQADYYLKARTKFFPRTEKLTTSDLIRIATTWYLVNVEPWVGIPGIDGENTAWKKPEFVRAEDEKQEEVDL